MHAQHESTTAASTKAGQGKDAELQAGLAKLAVEAAPEPLRAAARLRNYFLAGVVISSPIALTLYITWRVINIVDTWIRPLLSRAYDPDSNLPFAVPGVGLLVALIAVTLIGALAAHLIGRSLFSASEMMLMRVPVVRNVYRGLHDIFSSIVAAAGHDAIKQKVALVQFPSEGIWSLAFITGNAAAAINARVPGDNLISIFIPHGLVPPSGITCFVRCTDVIPIRMRVEDAAKIIFSAGMAHPTESPSPRIEFGGRAP